MAGRATDARGCYVSRMRCMVAIAAALLLTSASAGAQSADDNVPKPSKPTDASAATGADSPAAAPDESADSWSAAPVAPDASPTTSDDPAVPAGPSEAPPARVEKRLPASAYEPPPPGSESSGPVTFEPPPPPQPHHRAPKTSLWVGARLGWFLPFGNVWARAMPQGSYYALQGVPWSDYAASGTMIEGDVGLRLGRNYNLFLGWERAQLGAGKAETSIHGDQQGGDSDFWGIGLRANSDPDRVGFISEVMIGYRRARASWSDGTEIQFTDAPFEARLGLGAEFRVSSGLTISPMLTLGAGAFGTIKYVDNSGNSTSALGPLDEGAGHGWLTLQVGGHFDLAGSQ